MAWYYWRVTHKGITYERASGERAVHERRAMSLIRVRKQRKKNWIDKKESSSPRRLVILLIMLVGVIWWLGFRF